MKTMVGAAALREGGSTSFTDRVLFKSESHARMCGRSCDPCAEISVRSDMKSRASECRSHRRGISSKILSGGEKETVIQAIQSGIGQRFVPVVENGGKRRLALDRAGHGAEDRGHKEQRGKALTKTDMAERGKADQDCGAQSEADENPVRLQFTRQIWKERHA